MTETHTPAGNQQDLRFAIVGRGRLGRALVAALATAGARAQGPLARGEALEAGVDVVLLCVPERELAAAVASLVSGPAKPLVGHCSASAPLSVLAPHERFSAHPLMTVTDSGATFGRATHPGATFGRATHPGATFTGAACAVDGSSERALDVAVGFAARLGMVPVRVPTERRALYHAAASLASNFLVTLESAAERLASECGVERAHLAPLVRATVTNWEAQGFGAITGPLARGDDATVAAQRAAIAEHAGDLLPLWDALAERTRAMLDRAR